MKFDSQAAYLGEAMGPHTAGGAGKESAETIEESCDIGRSHFCLMWGVIVRKKNNVARSMWC